MQKKNIPFSENRKAHTDSTTADKTFEMNKQLFVNNAFDKYQTQYKNCAVISTSRMNNPKR